MRSLESRRNRRHALDAEQSLAATQLRTVSVDVGALQYERKRSSIGTQFITFGTNVKDFLVSCRCRCYSALSVAGS